MAYVFVRVWTKYNKPPCPKPVPFGFGPTWTVYVRGGGSMENQGLNHTIRRLFLTLGDQKKRSGVVPFAPSVWGGKGERGDGASSAPPQQLREHEPWTSCWSCAKGIDFCALTRCKTRALEALGSGCAPRAGEGNIPFFGSGSKWPMFS